METNITFFLPSDFTEYDIWCVYLHHLTLSHLVRLEFPLFTRLRHMLSSYSACSSSKCV